MKPPPVPRDLGKAGRDLWRGIASDYELGPGDLALLRQACDTADHCDQLRAEAAGVHHVIRGRLGQEIPHPVYAELRSERRLLLALLGGLGLTASAAESSPPGPGPQREEWAR